MRALRLVAVFSALALISTAAAQAEQRASLSEAEVEKLRDTQDPGERIKLYLQFMQERLTQFDEFRNRPVDPRYRTGKFLDEVLGQYIDLDDELKDWIQYQYNRDGDMRKGLHVLLEEGPRQLAQLQHIRQTPDPYTSRYADRLQDAVADLEDTLDGATAALNGQIKKLGELKKEGKAAEKASNAAIKEEKKRIKEEEKLRKKERKEQHEN
jgi:hypothetical protein